MQKIILLLYVFIFSGCATIINRKMCTLNVSTSASDARIVCNGVEFDSPHRIKVARSASDLRITVCADSMKTDFTVESRLSREFWLGNPLALLYLAPVGWVVDLNTPKRFTYGKTVFLDVYDTVRIIRPKITPKLNRFLTRQYPSRKGRINLTASYPVLNSYYFKPQGEPLKAWEGCMGIGLGVEYFYTDMKAIQLRADAIADFMVPVPAAVDYFGDYETLNSWYVSIMDCWKIRRFTFGYGFNYAVNAWQFHPSEYDSPDLTPLPPAREYAHKANRTIGFTLSSYFHVWNCFYIGVVYRPSVYRLSPHRGFLYEHAISLDTAVKVALRKAK